MATHVNIPATGSGDAGPIPVATTDDGSGNKHQQVVVESVVGTTPTPVTTANPLPVSVISNIAEVTDGSGFQHQEVIGEYLVGGVPQAVDAAHPLPVTNTPSGTQTVSGTVTANVGTTNGLALDATLTGGTQLSRVTGPSGSTAAVKAGSSAAATTDAALVVAISPNNTPVLPSGAATQTTSAAILAKQPALGTAGTPSADVLSIQGVAGGTAIPVSGGGTPTDVSAGPTTLSSPGTVTVSSLNGMSTLIVEVTASTTSGSSALIQGTNNGGTTWEPIPYQSISTSVPGASSFNVDGTGVWVAKIAGYSSVRLNIFTLPSGSVTAQIRASAGTFAWDRIAITGSLSANQSVNTSQINGVTPLMGNGNSGTGAQRVTIAADSTGQIALAAGSNLVGKVGIDQTTPGTTDSVTVKNSFALDATLTGGTQTTKIVGGSTAVVKAASTAPAATDPSLVVTISPNSSNASTNIAQFAGAAVAQGHGTAATALRVELPTDGTGVVGLAAGAATVGTVNLGTLNGAATAAGVATVNTTLGTPMQQTGGTIGVVPGTTGGLTVSRTLAAGSTNATNVKASAGQVYGWFLANAAAYTVFLKLYNSASAPTAGSGTPVMTIPIPAGAAANVNFTQGIAFSSGIGFTITKLVADADTTVVVANDLVVNLLYA